MDNFHSTAAKNIARSNHEGIADFLGKTNCFLFGTRSSVRGLTQLEFHQELLESFAILSDIDRLRRGAHDWNTRGLQGLCEFQGCLAAVLNDDPNGLFFIDNLKDILKRERLKIQPIGSVVIC